MNQLLTFRSAFCPSFLLFFSLGLPWHPYARYTVDLDYSRLVPFYSLPRLHCGTWHSLTPLDVCNFYGLNFAEPFFLASCILAVVIPGVTECDIPDLDVAASPSSEMPHGRRPGSALFFPNLLSTAPKLMSWCLDL